MRLLALALIVAMGLAGCAKLKDPFSPGPTPSPPQPMPLQPTPPLPSSPPRPSAAPVEPAPSPPPAVLSLQVGSAEERRLQRDARSHIDRTERLLRRVDPKRLAGPQQESFLTIQSFVAKAKEALYARDVQRAMTLAEKAYLLAEELSRGR